MSQVANVLLVVLMIAGILVVGVLVKAQGTANLPEVAVLCSRFCFDTPTDLQTNVLGQALLRGLKAGGYVEGKDFVLSLSASNVGPDLAKHAADLARRKPAAILAVYTDAVQAARSATATVPIVMVMAGDAVEQVIVASLRRPGGNVTGVTFPSIELLVKHIELLKEIVPGLRRLAVLANPSHGLHARLFDPIDDAARRLGIGVQRIGARGEAEFDAAIAAIGPGRPVGLLVLPDTELYSSRSRGQLAQRALAAKIPLVAMYRFWAQSLALMAYEPSRTEMFERAGALVAKVLRGARPADVPVEEPTRYELFLNLTTARALGITIPESVRVRADEVFP